MAAPLTADQRHLVLATLDRIRARLDDPADLAAIDRLAVWHHEQLARRN